VPPKAADAAKTAAIAGMSTFRRASVRRSCIVVGYRR
jgi:hypothetical protein